jgi:hypothetical protein
VRAGKQKLFFVVLSAVLIFAVAAALCPAFAGKAAEAYSDADTVYNIYSQKDFETFTSYAAKKNFSGKTINIYCNLDFSELSFQFADGFAGTFNGNGNIISGAGKRLFYGAIASTGNVKNIIFRGCAITGDTVLASINNGVVSSVSFYGTHTGSKGVVSQNNNTLYGVNTFLAVNGDVALAYINSVSGVISNCFNAQTAVLAASSAHVFSSVNSGSVTGCAAAVSLSYSSDITVYPFGTGNGSSSDCSCLVYSASVLTDAYTDSYYTACDIADSYYSSSVSTATAFDAAGNKTSVAPSALVSSLIGGGFDYLTDIYPVPDNFLSGSGVAEDKFILDGICDADRLVAFVNYASSGNGFYAKLFSDTDAKGFDGTVAPLGLGRLTGTVDGGGSVLYNAQSAFFDAFPDVDCTAVSVESSFGGDGYEDGTDFSDVAGTTDGISGDGTAASPYAAGTAEQLAGLVGDAVMNSAGKYAVITKNIYINSVADGNNSLGLGAAELKCVLDGADNYIVNADGTLFGTVSGEVKNLNVILSAHGDSSAVVCSVLTGALRRVFVTGSHTGTLGSVFASENDGTVEECENGVTADNALCASGTGTANYVIDFAGCAAFSNDLTKVSYSLSVGTENYIICGAMTKSVLDNATLTAAGYDTAAELGYKVGGTLEYPELRRDDTEYRVDAASAATVNKLSDFYGSPAYSPDVSYSVADLESGICDDSGEDYSAAFSWKFDGEAFGGTEISGAGTYTVTVTVTGDKYLPSVSEQIFTIKKGAYADGIKFDGFDPLEYAYSGASVSAYEPDPSNKTDLVNAGFALAYSYSSADTVDCGTYTQTITASSADYETLTRSRVITVAKAVLAVVIGNASATYGQSADFSAATADATGAVGKDAEKSFEALVEEEYADFRAYFSTSYTVGSDAGTYEIGYALSSLKNYTLGVTGGVLTVGKAELITDGITFSDVSVTYDAAAHTVSATDIPDGVTVAYENNSFTHAGVYTARATLSKANYNDKILTAKLTIEKAVIKLTASNLDKSYGYAVKNSDFGYTYSGLCGSDVFTSAVSGCSFSLCADGTEENSKPDAGTYAIKIIVSGTAADYEFTETDGVLTVGKVKLTTLYTNNSGGENTDFDDYSHVYTGENFARAITAFSAYATDTVYTYYDNSGTALGTLYATDSGVYTVRATVTPTGETAKNYETTEYSCKLTITKIATSLAFSKSAYSYVYAYGEDYADIKYYDYSEDGIPAGGTVGFRCTPVSAAHVGTYTVEIYYGGDANHASADASARLDITARPVTLTLQTEYVYAAQAVTPVITGISYGTGTGDLTAADFGFSYTENTYGGKLDYIANAGSYTVAVACKNTDFILTGGSFTLTVQKLAVNATLGNLSFVYGTVGEYTDGTGADCYVYGETVTYLDYYVAATGKYEDINFRLSANSPAGGRYPVGIYTVENGYVTRSSGNYDFILSGNDTVTVTQRTLSVMWTLDGLEMSNADMSALSTWILYSGTVQTGRISWKLSNFAVNDGASCVIIEKTVTENAQTADIYGAGEYPVRITLSGNPNYILDSAASVFTVIVRRIALTVTVNDAKVMRGENYSPSFTAGGLVGNDVGKNLGALEGYSFTLECGYVPATAQVGETYSVGGTFGFSNYTASTVNPGTVTVIDGYPEYVLPNASYVYDGADKTLTVAGEQIEGVTVNYGNNVQKNAGVYDVTATVVYPTGRQSHLSAKLTITRAAPIINCSDTYRVYKTNTTLSEADIKASASLNGIITSVDGVFRLAENYVLKSGENTYGIIFTPTDGQNFSTVSAFMKITAYAVSGECLVFSGDYTCDGDGNIVISARTEITLDKSYYPGIADNLSLAKNGETVSVVALTKEETVSVDVKYLGTSVYNWTFSVKLASSSDGEKTPVSVNYKMLNTSGVTFDESGVTIYVSEGATIEMGSGYSDDYALYIDGQVVSGKYTVPEGTESLTVIIKSKKLGISMYTQIFTVESESEITPGGNSDGGNETGFKTYYYYIIGGAAALVAVAVALVLLLRRKN